MSTLLSINNYYYRRGGAEGVFLQHNELFQQRGWQVVPFAMRHPLNLETPWSEYFAEEIEFGGEYSAWQRLIRAPRVIYSRDAQRRLDRLLRQARPDVAHAHNVYHHLSPAVLHLLHRRGIPTVLTVHDLKIACPAYSMLAQDGVCERCRGGRLRNVVRHRCMKGSLALSTLIWAESSVHRILQTYTRCVDQLIVPSRFFLEKLCEWGFPRQHFRYVPNFVDVEAFEADFTPGAHFIYVGRLSREKGLHTLVRAAALAGVRLQVAGTGPELASLREWAARLGADVTFLGHLSGNELQRAVRGARALVLPSECYENAPLSVLEAYACGKPVLGARIGGIPELIRPGETGITFESGNAESLATALDLAARWRGEDIEAMGRRARQWVGECFSASLYRDRMAAIYAELGVSESGRAPATERARAALPTAGFDAARRLEPGYRSPGRSRVNALKVMVLGVRGIPNVQGGIETHAEHLYPRLSALGCQVDVLVRSPYVPASQRSVGPLRLRRLWSPRAPGVEAFVHSLIGAVWAGLTRPDILHIHAVGPALVTPLARLFGLKVVVTHHGPDYERDRWGAFARWVLRTGEALGMRFANARIAISRGIVEAIRSKYGRDADLIPNGTKLPDPMAQHDVLDRYGLNPGRYFLQVARIVPEKRQLDLIQAFAAAKPPGWQLALVGGAVHADYAKQVREAAASCDVVLTGFKSGRELQQFYANAGAFVLPSSHEGHPIAILEALSYGLPVVASDIPANLEIGMDAHAYFPTGDVSSLADRLARVSREIQDDAQRAARRAWVARCFDWDAIAARTLSVYQRVLGDQMGTESLPSGYTSEDTRPPLPSGSSRG